MSAHDAGFVYMSENAALDEVFEHYVDVDAFIDSQFKFALGGEEEMYSSIHETHAITRASKMEAQIEDGRASKAATLDSFDFSFGSDTQINLDRTIPLSPQEELQTSRKMCYRCREIVEENSSACQLSKTTRETPHNLKDGGIELEERTTDPRKAVVTELQLADISDDVGTCWRELGPKLKIAASKIHNLDEEYRCNRDKANALLIRWKQQEGRGATVGCLADALESIVRKSIAEKLLGVSDSQLPSCTCVTASEGEAISLTVKCNLNAEWDSKLMLCEDADGNKFVVKAIKDSEGCWNSEEIQKNKRFLETVAAAAQDMGKTADQRRQESLKRISSEVQELRQQLKRVKLDCGDTAESCSEISNGHKVIQDSVPANDFQVPEAKVLQQDPEHSLQSCEEQHSLCQGMYNELIKLVGEVGQPRPDNFTCIKQLFDFTRELREQEKTFFPKIEQLNEQKSHLDHLQVTRVEELEKWKRAQKEQVEGVEKLLSSLLKQEKIEKSQKLLNRKSEPIMGMKTPSGFGRKRSKTVSSKSKSQSLSELPEVSKKCSISAPVCAQRMCLMDTDKKLKNEKA